MRVSEIRVKQICVNQGLGAFYNVKNFLDFSENVLINENIRLGEQFFV